MIIFCDIDGVLADAAHRLHYIDCPDKDRDWDGYFNPEEMKKDTVIGGGHDLLRTFANNTNTYIVLLTARQERARESTEEWLSLNSFIYDELIMRTDGDVRRSAEVKGDVVNRFKKINRIRAMTGIDDNSGVIEMYISKGVYAMQVKGHRVKSDNLKDE